MYIYTSSPYNLPPPKKPLQKQSGFIKYFEVSNGNQLVFTMVTLNNFKYGNFTKMTTWYLSLAILGDHKLIIDLVYSIDCKRVLL